MQSGRGAGGWPPGLQARGEKIHRVAIVIAWLCWFGEWRGLASISPGPARGQAQPRKGVCTLPIIQITTTLREAPVLAKAMDEYRENHPNLHPVFEFRLKELAGKLRELSERGLQEEAEKEARRWGKH